FYLSSQRAVGRNRSSTLPLLPLLMALGIGLSANNARAVLGAILGRESAFVRTPKHHLLGTRGDWRGKRYRGPSAGGWTAIEILFAVYFAAASVVAVQQAQYASLPFLLLFLGGFLTASLLSLARILPGSGPSTRSAPARLEETA
ncbi:MAG TPA: glycosyl transferase family 2, partial [Candidatus Polarisedimenticolia bacterium]|nr:glycosyl transferase family 2 [Candidatus Polarisedimenticolia bacterium]